MGEFVRQQVKHSIQKKVSILIGSVVLISPRWCEITPFEGRSLIWSYNNTHNSQQQHSAASFQTPPSPHWIAIYAPRKSIMLSVTATEVTPDEHKLIELTAKAHGQDFSERARAALLSRIQTRNSGIKA